MASFEDLRKHVMDDALELMIVLGIFTPLVNDLAPGTGAIPDEYHDVSTYMRQHFGLQMLLLLERLHAGQPRQETTGETASIVTMLDAAERERALTMEQVDGFRFRRQRIRDDLEGEGVTLAAMKELRHAEIGHSLHRTSNATDATLRSEPIVEYAHATYELLLDMERAGGNSSFLDPWYHTQMTKGRWFWDRIVGPQSDEIAPIEDASAAEIPRSRS